MDVDPRRLRVFLAVVRSDGVVGASRVLHLTPQAVSQQLATLEDELGVQLFDRTRRRLAPTAVGLALAAHAERIEAELIAAGRSVAAATGRASGIVRIAAFQSASAGSWSRRFRSFVSSSRGRRRADPGARARRCSGSRALLDRRARNAQAARDPAHDTARHRASGRRGRVGASSASAWRIRWSFRIVQLQRGARGEA